MVRVRVSKLLGLNFDPNPNCNFVLTLIMTINPPFTYLGLLRILHDRRPALASMVRSTCSNRLALSSARWCPGMGASWL